ncbi:hypothetical protein BH23ACT5_BH23ACT5_09620 [soil metagenome]
MDDLCRRLADDLETVFPELVTTLADDVYSGLRHMAGADDAEDLTQETFIRAYRALSGYERARISELKLRGWIWTIALNLGRNHARDRSRRPTPVMLEDRHATHDPEPPDSEAWRRRLGSLSGPQRTAVVLRHVVGLEYAHIAEATGRAEGTVKSDVHRGLERLRSIMEEEE